MRAIGRRFQLPRDVIAEVYDNGEIVLTRGDTREEFSADGFLKVTNQESVTLFGELGVPINLHDFIQRHGRPCGLVWSEK